MMGIVIIGIVVVWLVVSVAASLAIAALSRGGLQEERSRRHLVDHR